MDTEIAPRQVHFQRRQWHPTPVLLAEGQTRLSDFTFPFHFHSLEKEMEPTPVFLPGESQGWGAWWAAVCGVAQSRTRLKQLSSSSSQVVHITVEEELV